MKTEAWSSRLTFLCATITCSVGLGNLWRFPYVAGENGGGAFVLVYIGFVLTMVRNEILETTLCKVRFC